MGQLFKIPGYSFYIIGSLWSFLICLSIVKSVLGTLGVLVGIFIFPATLYLAPLYAGFVQHNWFPALLAYGTGIGSAVLIWIGNAIESRSRP